MTLTNSGATWTLTGHDDSVETYTVSALRVRSTPSRSATATRRRLPILPACSLPSAIPTAARFGLSYTSGLLTQVTTPDSLVLTYGYNAGGTLLTSVCYNTSPTTSQSYNYTNASFPTALTSITDELVIPGRHFPMIPTAARRQQ